MVDTIRNVETALGTAMKTVLPVEAELHAVARRAIHATAPIAVGDAFTDENVAVLRSGQRDPGLAPKHVDSVLGATAAKPLSTDEGVQWDHLADVTPDEDD